MADVNLNLTVPEELLRRLEILATQRKASISSLITAKLVELADEEVEYCAAREGMVEDMQRGYDVGTHGQVGWTRDSLQER